MDFRWIDWNIQKCEKHSVDPEEAEYVVRHARPPYPAKIGDEKTLVRGQTATGRYVQVIFLVDEDNAIFVIHAMPLSDRDRRNFRRSQR